MQNTLWKPPPNASAQTCNIFMEQNSLPCSHLYIHMYKHTCNSCNIGKSDLPDMYAQSPKAAGPRSDGMYIRQIMNAYVITNM